MCVRASEWLHRATTGWVALCATAAFLLFAALALPRQSASTADFAGDVGAPDTAFYYTSADLYRFAEAYGPEGRVAYIRARFTFDLVFPIIYTIFLATAITWLYVRAFPADSRWQLANLAPIVGAILDYGENVSTSVVMCRYPAPTTVVDVLAPIFSLTKWVFVAGSFVLLIIGVGVAIWRWHRAKEG